jgi:hypothetical protein
VHREIKKNVAKAKVSKPSVVGWREVEDAHDKLPVARERREDPASRLFSGDKEQEPHPWPRIRADPLIQRS